MDALVMYGAYEGRKLAGMIAVAENGRHIALFFVEEAYRGRGAGTALFNRAFENSTAAVLTVNSSPGAVKIYERLGFVAAGPARTVGGIVFIPMCCCRKQTDMGAPPNKKTAF